MAQKCNFVFRLELTWLSYVQYLSGKYYSSVDVQYTFNTAMRLTLKYLYFIYTKKKPKLDLLLQF